MNDQKWNDILKIISHICVTIILTIETINFFDANQDISGGFMIVAMVSFGMFFNSKISDKRKSWALFVVSLLYSSGLSYYYSSDFCLDNIITVQISLFTPYLLHFFLLKRKFKWDVPVDTKISDFFFFTALISFCYMLYRLITF